MSREEIRRVAGRYHETPRTEDEVGILQRGRARVSRDGIDQTRRESSGDSPRGDNHGRSRSEGVFVTREEKTGRVARVVDIGDIFSGNGAEFEHRG